MNSFLVCIRSSLKQKKDNFLDEKMLKIVFSSSRELKNENKFTDCVGSETEK